MTELKNKKLRIAKVAYAVVTIGFLSSCSIVHTALQQKTISTENEIAGQEYIEDFYYKPVIQATQSPEPVYDFKRAEIRTAEKEVFYTGQRPMDAYLYADALIDGDIGGEDIEIVTPAVTENAEVISEKSLSGLPEINDFGTSTATEKFDPTKLIASITVDVRMNDVSCFNMPVSGVINSNFGWRRGRVHSGIDLDLETGDHVFAALDGEVTTAEYHGGYGNLVILKHDNGLETYYAHLSKIEVKVGDKILSGEELGLGGSTGRSTGPHLHFETRFMGAAFDPSKLVDFQKQELKVEQLVLDKNTFSVTSNASKNSSNTSSTTKKYYNVKKGDTLGKIASRNKTTVSKICKLNGISSKKIIKPGMKLRVK
ncbi:MAG: peptidoglycan DD-metalloendopeptidase family protein [Fimbriimonadaceae bacterium]|nr:peptidoglycan DD-metalloendopeptidase family protein [Chitinophagales bacterium]